MQLGMNIGGPFHREIALAISLLLSFVMGVWIALLYNATYRGLSFSKNFLHALVLSPIVLSIAMHAVGDHLARGIGMAGALSMVRFRSSLKDPRDMFFLFAAIAIGVACGVGSLEVAIFGATGFTFAVLILSKTNFITPGHFDGLLRFSLESGDQWRSALTDVLGKYCQQSSLVSVRELAQGKRMDYAYQIRLKSDQQYEQLVQDLNKIPSIQGAHFLIQENTLEV